MNTLITETTEFGDIPVDIYQKLSDNRILFINNDIDDITATDIIANLILKDSENSDEKITLFINSEGGDIRNVLMIYDVMQMIQAPIETICIGAAMDEAAILLVAGTPGMRFITKNSFISISQLVHDYARFSDLTDAKQSLNQSVVDNKKMMEIFAKSMNKSVQELCSQIFVRRVFMTPSQAIKMKLVDKIVAYNK